MGKQRKDKKVKANSQEPSSSSSKDIRKRTMNKMVKDNSQKEKKLKEESKTKVHESSINDLPPEMLMKVLKRVDSESLVGCRLVNRQWNGIASQAGFDDLPPEMLNEIFKKMEMESLLNCRLVNRKWNELSCQILSLQTEMKLKTIRTGRLEKFTESFNKSKISPCTCFVVQLLYFHFSEKPFKNFIIYCKPTIKSLKLEIKGISMEEELDRFSKNLSQLLLTGLPHLQEFGVTFNRYNPFLTNSTVQLFIKPSQDTKHSGGSKTKVKTVELPRLKVLYLPPFVLTDSPGIVKDLVLASVNLKKIEPFSPLQVTASTAEHFKFLHSLGKLHLVEAAEITPSQELFTWIEYSTKAGKPVVFKLSKLILNTNYDRNFQPSVEKFLKIFFDSVKDTLVELYIKDLRYLKHIQTVKFSKLKSLRLYIYTYPVQNSLTAVNSTFTGISMKNCQVLHDKIQAAKKPMPKCKKLEAEKSLEISKSDMKKMRESPSILDLKGLKKLDIVKSFSNKDPSFFDVSTKFAFDLMPNTTVSFPDALQV